MGTRMIWKSRGFRNGYELRQIDACWGSSHDAFGPGRVMTIDHSGGGGYLETNLPWRDLARVFSLAAVPLRRDEWVTDSMPLEERVKVWEQEEAEEVARLKAAGCQCEKPRPEYVKVGWIRCRRCGVETVASKGEGNG